MKDEVAQRDQRQAAEEGKGDHLTVQGGIRHGINLEVRKMREKSLPPVTSHQDRPLVPEPIHMESACVWNRPARYTMNVSSAL